MKLSAQIALIVSALALPLSAYAEEGENSKQTITVQPQTEIATRANEMVGRGEGMGSLSSFRGGSFNFSKPFSDLAKDFFKGKFTPNVAQIQSNKDRAEKLVDKLGDKNDDKGKQTEQEKDKNNQWDRQNRED